MRTERLFIKLFSKSITRRLLLISRLKSEMFMKDKFRFIGEFQICFDSLAVTFEILFNHFSSQNGVS